MKNSDLPDPITRPLLAGAVGELNEIKFPILCTPKIDGIRVLKVAGKAVTRQFKPIPNLHIRKLLEECLPDNIDGEVITSPSFNQTQSDVMSIEGTPAFTFYAFDYVKTSFSKPYQQRVLDLNTHVFPPTTPFKIVLLLPEILFSVQEILWYENKCVEEGFEGIMLRNPLGKYKCGRSTQKEQILLKMKRFFDAEARIIGFEEKMRNNNAQQKNSLGLSKRASKKIGLVPANTLGSIVVQDVKTGAVFSIGSGFDESLRADIWKTPDRYLSRLITYKYQSLGENSIPRFPVFLGFRRDL